MPIALGYTRGHFSALVGMEQPKSTGNHVTYLPLVDSEMKRLPLHFISEQEVLFKHCPCFSAVIVHNLCLTSFVRQNGGTATAICLRYV